MKQADENLKTATMNYGLGFLLSIQIKEIFIQENAIFIYLNATIFCECFMKKKIRS